MNPIRSFTLLAALLCLPIAPVSSQEGHHSHSPDERYYFPQQVVEVADFDAEGWILAIGGGGESVIGQFKGDRVVAIDISRRELEEAPGKALKIVMDARDLQFLDGTFDVAVSFFTLMYVDGADHRTVFDEAFRVLRPGGRLLIWDAIFGERPDERIQVGVVPLTVKLPGRKIETGYGVHWPDEHHDLAYYKRLAQAAGFEPGGEKTSGAWFHLVVRKPTN